MAIRIPEKRTFRDGGGTYQYKAKAGSFAFSDPEKDGWHTITEPRFTRMGLRA